MDDFEDERRRRRGKKRRAAAVNNPAADCAGNSLLDAIRQELEGGGFTALPGNDGNAVHLECRYFPPEDAHYRDEDGQPRVLVTLNCSQPGHVHVAAPNAFDVRDACNKTAIAAVVHRLEQHIANVGITYHGGRGFVVPYVTVPKGALAADPRLALRAIICLLTDVHQLAPVMGNLIRTGRAVFSPATFAIPACTNHEIDDHLAMLARRGMRETAEHTKRFRHEINRRFGRFAKRYGADPDLAKRVLGQIAHSPRVLNAQLFRNQVVAINAKSDYRAHPAMLQSLDRLLEQERRRT